MSDSELYYAYSCAHGAVLSRRACCSLVTELQSCTLYSVFIHTDIPAPTIYQLTEELMGMKDWYSLGVALRVHPNELQEIQKSSPQEGRNTAMED